MFAINYHNVLEHIVTLNLSIQHQVSYNRLFYCIGKALTFLEVGLFFEANIINSLSTHVYVLVVVVVGGRYETGVTAVV